MRHICMLLSLIMLSCLVGCNFSSEEGDSGHVDKDSIAIEVLDPFASLVAIDIADVETGLSKLNELVKAFKQEVESNQPDQARLLAVEMCGVWKAIREDSRLINVPSYLTLQEDFAQLYQHVNADAFDTSLLVQLDYKLYQGLRDATEALQAQQ